ncbi:MAG: imidazole glycerol phosphate synthase subunit HisH [Myxococcota bacterium]
MTAIPIAIIDTRAANLASVEAGLSRVGFAPHRTVDKGEVERAAHVVLPGVGAFGEGAKQLEELGLIDPLRQRLDDNRPLLAVCLGLQLLFESSEESEGARGLGVFRGRVERFREATIVPQLGWNKVEGGRLVEPGYAYFANSYRVSAAPQGTVASFAHHGERFVAAIEKGRLLACQFHPELSGAWGHALLERWREKVTASC